MKMHCHEQEVGTRRFAPLRVAVILDIDKQHAWLGTMLERVKALTFVDICLILHQPKQAAVEPTSTLWQLFRRVDDRLFGKVADALAPRDISALLHGVPRIDINTYFTELANIAKLQLDVLLDIREQPRPGAFSGVARYGVWSFNFGDVTVSESSKIGHSEVANLAPLTVSRLMCNVNGQVIQLYQSYARTVPFSPRRNRDNTLWKSATFPSRALTTLYQSQALPCASDNTSDITVETPAETNTSVLLQVARMATASLRRAWEITFFVDQWFVGFKFSVEPEHALPPSCSDFHMLVPPKDRFWADPFAIERDGRYFIFIEELTYANNKGHISIIEVRADGSWTEPRKVLERDYHLSYPFLFEWDGALFMLPETGHNRSVEVYRCHHFPDDWRLEAVLLKDVQCADATLEQIHDRWWMFINIAEKGTELYDELHVYHADQPFGPWTPHCKNPVKSDARTARPAGKLFWHDGQLYRPAQCCAPNYGSAVSFNVVDQLDTREFVEHQVAQLSPGWRPGLLGLHTFNRAGRLTVIDCLQRAPRFSFSRKRNRETGELLT